MGVAFSAGADFSAMGPRGLFISRVIYKTFCQVDEKGTEAAAATAVMMAGIPISQRFEMKVDRPCLVAIRDNSSGQLLFLGAVSDP